MFFIKFTFLTLGVALVSGGVIKNVSEIKAFENFLKASVTGTLQDALTPELEAKQNIWERSGKFEGDILLSKDQIKSFVDLYSGNRNTVIFSRNQWTNGIVYYDYTEGEFDEGQIQAVESGLRIIESKSCLKFVRRQNERNYVRVTSSSSGCFSMVGELGGAQQLNLMSNEPGVGCFRQRVIIHEFLHAVGFHHQQSTYNRNEWVKILWENINPNNKFNFFRVPSIFVTNFDVEYDYKSIMHYNEYAFSTNGSKTIVALEDPDTVLGSSTDMSEGDVRKLNLMYKCIQE